MFNSGTRSYPIEDYSERKNVPLPDKFKCRVCKHIKGVSLFSKKEHLVYQHKIFIGGRVNPIMDMLLCCRGCNGSPILEMICKGPCNAYRALDDFSKTQRLNENPWCELCMIWKGRMQHNLPVTQVPHGAFSPDEAEHDGRTVMEEVTSEDQAGREANQSITATPATSESDQLIDVSTPGTSNHGTSTTGGDGSVWRLVDHASRSGASRAGRPAVLGSGNGQFARPIRATTVRHFPPLIPPVPEIEPTYDEDDMDEL